MTTVTASTSLILVTTSNLIGSTIVTFPNISTTGRIITVRDNDGFANSSNYIVLRATGGASFGGVSGSLLINQPFGFITLMSQATGAYSVLNTFAFPTGSAAAFVSNITATNLATLSTMQFQDRATSNIATMYVSGGQIILNEAFIGQITSNQLQSTVTHLGSLGYLSTVPLFASTQLISSLQTNFLSAGALTVGVFNPANITTTTLTATTIGATTGNFRTVSTGNLIVSSIQYRSESLAIGSNAGVNQQQNAIAIGTQVASVGTAQGTSAVAIGHSAGREAQGNTAIAIGSNAGADTQAAESIAIGSNAGASVQSSRAIAIGAAAGRQSQGLHAVAVGLQAGQTNQGIGATAIGFNAGLSGQNVNGVAIGNGAGNQLQGASAVAIGTSAGFAQQGLNGIAIGESAGASAQGSNAIAIGAYAGLTNQSTNTIILNATGATLNTPLSNATFIKPIRQDLSLNTTKGQLYYTSTTGELTFGPALVSTFSSVTVNGAALVRSTFTFAQRIANPLPSQLVLRESGTGSMALKLGAYYTLGQGSASVIQSTDFFSSVDNGAMLLLNPLGGNVGIGVSKPSDKLHVNSELTAPLNNVIRLSVPNLGQTNEVIHRIVYGNNAFGNNDITAAIGFLRNNSANNNNTSVNFYTYSGVASGSDLAVERMRISPSGFVGIGTSSPTEVLDVYSTMQVRYSDSSSEGFFRFWPNGKEGHVVRYGGTGDGSSVLRFLGVGNSEAMRISYGNVGIGTSTPAYLLDVNGGFRVIANTEIRPLQNGQTYLYMNAYDNSLSDRRVRIGNYHATHGPGPITLNELGSGDVGIGTSNPSQRLDVNGNIRAFNAANDVMGLFATSYGGYLHIGAWNQTGATSKNIVLNEYGGNVGIGTASPAYTLDVNGTIAAGDNSINTRITLTNPSAGRSRITADNSTEFYIGTSGFPNTLLITNSDNGSIGIGGVAPTPSIKLDVNGVIRTRNDFPVKPTGGQWITFSDQRIKTNIQLADNSQCYEIMKAINLYHYRYIDEFYSTNKVIDKGQLGFIAQNVSSIFPKAISVIPEYGYDDLLVLNPSQIHLAHYGATRKLMDVIEVQSTTIQNQQTDINLLKSQVMHLFNYVSANIMRGD